MEDIGINNINTNKTINDFRFCITGNSQELEHSKIVMKILYYKKKRKKQRCSKYIAIIFNKSSIQ